MSFIKTRFQGFIQYKDLLKLIVDNDIKLKYRRSFLGYIWSILNPLLIMLVMVAVFSQFFEIDIPNFPVYMLTGSTLFTFMTEATNAGLSSILSNAPLIKKTYVPKYIFTVSKVTSSLVNLLFSMGALILVILVTRSKVTWYVLLSPLIIIELYIFCLGLGLFLASATVYFRDVQYLWGVITTAWMYMTPIFYPVSIWPENVAFFLKMFNPMYSYIAQFRDLVLYGQLPGPNIVLGGIVFAVASLAFGTWVFYRGQDNFILYI